MKRMILALTLAALLGLTACSGPAPKDSGPVELHVFAAASLTETLTEIAEQYKEAAPDVSLVFTFDSSGTLQSQIESGADCDLFLSAAQKQMNALDASAEGGQDYIDSSTRMDLLKNTVVLVVPEGNPADVQSFEDAASDKVTLIALGNSDVPVGQYSEEIFTYLGLWDSLNEGQKITFGTNVKEVTSQVSAAAVDCGVVYGTDAYSAGLTVVAEAPEGSCNPPVYPAAVLKGSAHPEEAKAFLDYLSTDAAVSVFTSVGFTMAG